MLRISSRALVVVALSCLALCLVPSLAVAKPSLVSPGNGAQVPYSSQAFSWTDNYAEGQLDHWYMEISTRPETDYYYFGFFQTPPVYASGSTRTASLNLNTLGRALAPGTYYWHVVGYYGWLGSNGTYWSPVYSFTVQAPPPGPGPVPPTIVVNPGSLSFTVAAGDTTDYKKTLDISNSGGTNMYFSYVYESQTPQWLWTTVGASTGTVYSLPVWVSGEGLSAGTRSARVRIQEPVQAPFNALPITNAPLDVWVSINVLPGETAAPTATSIVVDGGASTTRSPVVTLTLHAQDAGVGMGEMRLSNDGITWSQWMPYETSKQWQLTKGTGTKTVRAQFRDKLRNATGTVSDSIVYDVTPPSTATVSAPIYSTSSSRTRSVTVKWSASDVGAGVAGYDVDYRKRPATTWVSWGGIKTGSSAAFTGIPGATYEFRARAVDRAGNYGRFSAVAHTTFPIDQASGSYAKTWTVTSQSGAYLGTVKATRTRAASVTFRAYGKLFRLLVTTGKGRSRAKVYVDGSYVRAIDTYASATRYRQLIFLKSYAVSGAHTVKIVNSATSGRTLLQVDGLAAYR